MSGSIRRNVKNVGCRPCWSPHFYSIIIKVSGQSRPEQGRPNWLDPGQKPGFLAKYYFPYFMGPGEGFVLSSLMLLHRFILAQLQINLYTYYHKNSLNHKADVPVAKKNSRQDTTLCIMLIVDYFSKKNIKITCE